MPHMIDTDLIDKTNGKLPNDLYNIRASNLSNHICCLNKFGVYMYINYHGEFAPRLMLLVPPEYDVHRISAISTPQGS